MTLWKVVGGANKRADSLIRIFNVVNVYAAPSYFLKGTYSDYIVHQVETVKNKIVSMYPVVTTINKTRPNPAKFEANPHRTTPKTRLRGTIKPIKKTPSPLTLSGVMIVINPI